MNYGYWADKLNQHGGRIVLMNGSTISVNREGIYDRHGKERQTSDKYDDAYRCRTEVLDDGYLVYRMVGTGSYHVYDFEVVFIPFDRISHFACNIDIRMVCGEGVRTTYIKEEL